MSHLRLTAKMTALLTGLLLAAGCSGSNPETGNSSVGGTRSASSGGSTSSGGATDNSAGGASTNVGGAQSTGGNANLGGASNGGAVLAGGTNSTVGATSSTGGSNVGGATNGGSNTTGGKATTGGATNAGGAAAGGKATTAGATNAGGSTAAGGKATTGGATNAGGAAMGGNAATGGAAATGGTTGNPTYPCDGTTTGYNATMIKAGSTWTVTNGTQRYSGSATQAALEAAYASLTTGRTSKQSILVQGDGDIAASAQVKMPSYTVVNWCGTLNVSGSSSGDYSPFYARGMTNVEIANLTMTGSPSYGIFFRGTSNMVLGNITLNLTGGSPGIGIRVDTSGSAGSDTTFVTNLKIGNVTGGGMSSQLVETYGVDGITIGTITGNGVGECGLLLNRSINAEVDTVTCTDCGTGTGYAAFRVANSVGKIGSDWPAGNIHVSKVYARGGGRGIFSVSGCGGLTIDTIDVANTGNTSILLQNTYNTTIAATSGTVVGGLVQISNDTTNTNDGTFAPSKNVAIKNLVLSGGASVRQDWCSQYGANGCTATNVTGGTVSMCP